VPAHEKCENVLEVTLDRSFPSAAQIGLSRSSPRALGVCAVRGPRVEGNTLTTGDKIIGQHLTTNRKRVIMQSPAVRIV